jgi:hypothetical protein
VFWTGSKRTEKQFNCIISTRSALIHDKAKNKTGDIVRVIAGEPGVTC